MSTKRRNKSNAYCCVPQCRNYYQENLSFHRFPIKNKELCDKWIKALRIGKKVSPHMVVCSSHFRNEDYFFNRVPITQVYRLKRNSVPSQNLPKDSLENETNGNLKPQRQIHHAKRKVMRSENYGKQLLEDSKANNDLRATSAFTQIEYEVAQTILTLPRKVNKTPQQVEFVEKVEQSNTNGDFTSFDISSIIDTDHKLRTLTGIHNSALLDILVEAVYNVYPNKSKLFIKKIILLTLMRLKSDIPFPSLSILFKIKSTTAQTYFCKIIKILSSTMRNNIEFPAREEIRYDMPQSFKVFSQTQVILCSTEIKIQTSRLKCGIKSRSFCKDRRTIKFLIGIAPSGLIAYVSRPYGGKASNRAIFKKENLMSKLTQGDAIIVDRGFLIERECEKSGITLIRLPSQKNKTAETSRGHIKRVIQRIKSFRICRNVLSSKLAPYINDIMTVIVALINLSEPF